MKSTEGKQPIARWRYLYVQVGSDDPIIPLNDLGEIGWEAVCSFKFPGLGPDYILLKRPCEEET